MDPNANIGEQERLRVARAAGRLTTADRARLRELVTALRGWLDGGGFAPRWEAAPRTALAFGVDVVTREYAEPGRPAIWYVREFETVDAPLPHHVKGLSWTASGYGMAIPSSRVAVLPDGRRRRVFVTCYSKGTAFWSRNDGDAWIKVNGRRAILGVRVRPRAGGAL